MAFNDYKYSIVIPCYKSHLTIRKVVESAVEELEVLGIHDYEFVLVNDCSPDDGQTIDAIVELTRDYSYVKGVDLAKNGGQHKALLVGMSFVAGDFVISMDDDMQTDPTQLKFLIEEIHKGFDIVYGYYEKKEESAFRRFGSSVNNWTVRYLIGKPKWMKTSSFWIIRRFVADYATNYNNPKVHLQALFLSITKNIKCIPIKARAREVGKSGYTLKALLKLYYNIFFFSSRPNAIIKYLGVFFAFLAILLLILEFFVLIPGYYILGFGLTGILLVAIGLTGDNIIGIVNSVTGKPSSVIKGKYNIEE